VGKYNISLYHKIAETIVGEMTLTFTDCS